MDLKHQSRMRYPSMLSMGGCAHGVSVSEAYLKLEKGQQSSTNQSLPIFGRAKVVGTVATCWDIDQPKESSECILYGRALS